MSILYLSHRILCSVAELCLILRPHELQQARLPVLHYLPEFAQTHVHWVGDDIQPPHPLLPLLLPSTFPASGSFPLSWLFTSGGQIIWSFCFSISPSNEYSELISFRIDWFYLFVVQGTLKSLFQLCSSKASVLWCSAFFMVQFSHSYMITGKTTALTIRTFVGKAISLLFNMLSRFVIAFIPRSKLLLISWLQSPSESTKY